MCLFTQQRLTNTSSFGNAFCLLHRGLLTRPTSANVFFFTIVAPGSAVYLRINSHLYPAILIVELFASHCYPPPSLNCSYFNSQLTLSDLFNCSEGLFNLESERLLCGGTLRKSGKKFGMNETPCTTLFHLHL